MSSIIYSISLFFVYLLSSLSFTVKAKEKIDSLTYRNSSIMIDLASSYFTVFNSQKQLRLGIEYQQHISKKYFIALYSDFGLFKKYTFTKYYDLLNQQSGMYYIERKNRTFGFILTPSLNYYIITSKRKKNQGLFCGLQLENQYYRKKTTEWNSQQSLFSNVASNHYRLNVGPTAGIKYAFRKRLLLELKTSILFYIINPNKNDIETSLNHQWTNIHNQMGWLSHFKIGYEL